MPKLSYEVAHRLERYTTKKLIEFINNLIEIDDILKEINYEYPFFSDDSSRAGFKVWLSIDYINKDGKTFIDRFLDSKSNNLNDLEKDILIEKNKSFVSLFEIIGFEDDHMLLLDTLQNKEYSIWEPQMSEVLNEGEFIFTRIGRIVDDYSFIGEISYLPESVKSLFTEEVLIDFNNKRRDNPNLIIKDYLKKYSLQLIKNYNNCIFNAIEIDDDLNSYLYDELDEFEGYLKNKANNLTIGKHISNLVEFFEYYLAQEDLTLYDLDQLDFKHFFNEAISDGFINSQNDLNSYINTLKRYMNFLSNRSSEYKEAYLELLDISEDRFSYMESLKNFNTPFVIDRILESHIAGVLNDTAINILTEFDKFILYTVDNPLELTQKKKQIKRKNLIELYQLFQDPVLITKTTPNQEDFPIVNMFFEISLKLNLMEIEKNKLRLTKKGTNFIRLKDEEKFTLIFSCIWDNDFIKEVTTIEPNLIEMAKKDFVNLVSILVENKSYGVKYIISEYRDNPDNLFQINEYLKLIGLVKSKFYPSYTWEITKLGKTIFKYLHDKELNISDNEIVSLDNYRKKKL